MAKQKRFVLNQAGIKISLTFKKDTSERKAQKLASLFYWIVVDGGKISRDLAKATVTRK